MINESEFTCENNEIKKDILSNYIGELNEIIFHEDLFFNKIKHEIVTIEHKYIFYI